MISVIRRRGGMAPRTVAALAIFATVLIMPANGRAASFALTPTTTQPRLGRAFQVRASIKTSESIHLVSACLTVPIGFRVLGLPSPTIPETLSAGSTFETCYVIQPPSSTGESRQAAHEVILNVAYRDLNAQPGTIPQRQSIVLPLDLVQTRGQYIIYSMLGVLLGTLIKLLARRRHEGAAKEEGKPVNGQLVLSVCTTLLIGFVVLMGLSKDRLPAKSFYDSIALGAAIGALSDDQLLGQVGTNSPRS